MTIPIQAGQVYQIRAVLPYRLDGNSNGIRIGLFFPAARRASFGVVAQNTVDGGTPMLSTIRASGNSALITSGTTVDSHCIIDGVLLCSGAGNLMFFGASETANATARFMDGGSVIVWNLGPQAV
jgi:hypothetical protein